MSGATALAITGGVGYLGFHSLYTVDGGHRAVMWNRFFGISETVAAEGMHFRIPLIDYPYVYDVRTRPRNIQSLTGSKDLQMINITLRVLTKPDLHHLPTIYRRLGKDFDDRVLPSIVNEVTKAVVANYNAAELLTKREEVSRQIALELTKRAAKFWIIMEDVSITHLRFSNEYSAAVEAKQVAQQQSEQAKFVVEKALQEKKSIIIKAAGEAQSARLVGTAIKNNPGFVQLRRIEAAKEIASTVSNSSNKIYLSADTLLLNLIGGADEQLQKSVENQKAGWFGRK